MSLLPVITRELRAEARRPFTYWLRVIGAGLLLMAVVMLWMDTGLGHGRGGLLFMVLHLTLFGTIWVLVPVMTADCLSRERREGTLGLLFLTPLRARDVVVAKGLAHGLRAAALAVAALPVLTLPFLIGGVGWHDAAASALLNFSAFCLALGAGMLGSAGSRSLTRALVVALLWGFVLFLLFLLLQGVALFVASLQTFRSWPDVEFSVLDWIGMMIAYGWQATFQSGRLWRLLQGAGMVGLPGAWLINLSLVALLSVLGLRLMLAWAARNVRRHWQEKSPTPRRQKLEQQFLTPRFGRNIFRKWMRRLLERNPVGWLERRTWHSRLVTWGWLAVMIAIYSVALGDAAAYGRNLSGVQDAMAVLLVASMAMSAAGSFRRERETGLLELMLVTPLRVGQILNGRLRALWAQFLPASILFVALWVFLARAFVRAGVSSSDLEEQAVSIWMFSSTALTLPVVGLYCSLQFRQYVMALLGTAALGIGLPYLLTAAGQRWMSEGLGLISVSFVIALLAVLMGAVLLRRQVLRDYAWAVAAPFFVSGAVALVLVVLNGAYQQAGNWGGGSTKPGMLELDKGNAGLVTFTVIQLAVASCLAVSLHRALVRRKFAFPQ